MKLIKQYRLLNNLTQGEFGERIGSKGVCAATVHRWESGRKRIGREHLEDVARVLEINHEDLVRKLYPEVFRDSMKFAAAASH